MRNASCSPLLQLPLEVRNKIWASLLGDRLLHLEYGSMNLASTTQDEYLRSWSSTVCQYDRPEDEVGEDDITWNLSHSRCTFHVARRHGDYPYWFYCCGSKREQSTHEEIHLTALRVCRQIYNEADRVLWSTNTFSFDDEVTFLRFMDTRTTCQKRSLKKLRLQMNAWEDASWSSVLGIRLIRSLVGLRSLRLQINFFMHAKRYQWIKAHGYDWNPREFQRRLQFVQRMKVLPLTEVEVFIGEYSGMYDESLSWTAEDRTEYADVIRRTLLDPEGAEKYAQDQEDVKESNRQKRERNMERQALRAANQRKTRQHDSVQKLIEIDAGVDRKSDEI